MTLVNSKNSLSNIRQSFLDYFESKGHTHLPSYPLVPHNDPTLMFTNAGMVQFKNVFAGREDLTDKNKQQVTKAATVQKCVRAGGKHNDLENVGYTARHHTFFEMLGNFSFGDYFKEDAIFYAWEYLTKILKLPEEKLLVTVYHTDNEAAELWKKISGLSDDRIIRIATNDNFWAMGDTGPCGPCSEIFYDHGEHIEGGIPGSENEDGDRFIEIWNLVFMQYEKTTDGKMIDLPKPCIDTGMGLERITTVMQGIHDNYDTDLFQNLIEASKIVTKNNDLASNFSHRVIADHLRSTCFLIADGVLPSNEGRGYVLRRIMRRAMRHCHMLQPSERSFYKLVPYLVKEMGDAYPELKRAEDVLIQTIKNEENRFSETLDKGIKILDQEVENLGGSKVLKGEVAFKLYDTYGFPLDLTQDILKSKNIEVDVSAFNKAMEEQKDKARKAWTGSGEAATEDLWLEILKKNGITEFLGYTTLKGRGEVVALIKEGREVTEIQAEEKAIIITNQTPFYGESGGQAGDKGIIIGDNGKFIVEDTKKPAEDLTIHIGYVSEGSFNNKGQVKLEVQGERREGIKRAHSATHLLHAALKNVLGSGVTQKGSLVENDYLRFDFSHQQALTASEIKEIESQVNYEILQNEASITAVMPVQDAIDSGATALFGEKYGDEVRVISMGTDRFSVELCGGTHTERTGDIGICKITAESAVASGVRRIEAFTGVKAMQHFNSQVQIISELQGKFKTSPENILERINKLVDERKSLEKEVTELKKKLALSASSGAASSAKAGQEVQKIGDVNLVAKILNGVNPKDLRGLVDEYKKKYNNTAIILVAENEGKAGLVVGVSESLTNKLNAVELIKQISGIMGGKGGGGRPDFAQGGVPNAEKFSEAVEAIKSKL